MMSMIDDLCLQRLGLPKFSENDYKSSYFLEGKSNHIALIFSGKHKCIIRPYTRDKLL